MSAGEDADAVEGACRARSANHNRSQAREAQPRKGRLGRIPRWARVCVILGAAADGRQRRADRHVAGAAGPLRGRGHHRGPVRRGRRRRARRATSRARSTSCWSASTRATHDAAAGRLHHDHAHPGRARPRLPVLAAARPAGRHPAVPEGQLQRRPRASSTPRWPSAAGSRAAASPTGPRASSCCRRRSATTPASSGSTPARSSTSPASRRSSTRWAASPCTSTRPSCYSEHLKPDGKHRPERRLRLRPSLLRPAGQIHQGHPHVQGLAGARLRAAALQRRGWRLRPAAAPAAVRQGDGPAGAEQGRAHRPAQARPGAPGGGGVAGVQRAWAQRRRLRSSRCAACGRTRSRWSS